MENKLNYQAIEEYARAYARKETSSFFSKQDRISGEEILGLSPLRQVNLFVLRRLYEQWQKEAARLRSPYFDYEHTQVREAMKQFLNTLSKHILIGRAEFEPLLVKSVTDTLVLTLAPVEFFSKEVERYADPMVALSKLKELSKYITVNKILIQAVTTEMDMMRMHEAFAGEVVRLFYNAYKDHKFKVTDWYEVIDQLSTVQNVMVSDLLNEEETIKAPLTIRPADEAPLYLRRIREGGYGGGKPDEAKLEQEEVQKLSPADPDEERAEDTQSHQEEVHVDRAPETAAEFAPMAPVQEPENKPLEINVRKTAAEESEKAAEVSSVTEKAVNGTHDVPLYEKYAVDKKTLNESLLQGANATLLDKHQSSKIENIRNAIPLNQKFMLINELFDGDNITWSIALKDLDGAPTEEEARDLLINKWAVQYNWNLENEHVQFLLSLIQRKMY
jgi:hypothetical protein